MRELGNHGVITEPLAEAVIRAVALRNLLVHRFAEIDDYRAWLQREST